MGAADFGGGSGRDCKLNLLKKRQLQLFLQPSFAFFAKGE